MTAANALVWITARDGSIHVARPPIIASGHATLCARPYDRLDLRVGAPLRFALPQPSNACPSCCDAAGFSSPAAADARAAELAKVASKA